MVHVAAHRLCYSVSNAFSCSMCTLCIDFFWERKTTNLIDKLLIVPQVKSNSRGHNMNFFFSLKQMEVV